MENTLASKYINSFYFAVVTMSTIGYGDIAPVTDDEKLFMTFMSLFASMLFGYTINSLATIFSDYEQK
jgi:Ion channel